MATTPASPPATVTGALPPVVLVGLDSMQGLQAAREFRRLGIAVIGIAADPGHHACRTNACQRIVHAETQGPGLVDALMGIGETLQDRALLLPCQDRSVREISSHRESLARHFTFVLPPVDVVELLMDKDAFYAYAAAEGLPIPRTLELADRTDAERAAREMEYPCLLKPRTRTKEWDRNTRLKVFKVSDAEELLELYDRCSPWASPLIVQQWIEGDDSSLYSCNCYLDRESRPLATFVARKLRQWPPETGSSCLGEEVRNDEVLETTVELFRSLGYRGLGYLEVKRDARTGRHYIIEANVGRPTGRSAIAEAGGVPLLQTAYCDGMGLPLPPDRAQRYGGAKWIDLRHDLQSAFWYWRRGELGFREWLTSIRGRKSYAVLSLRDPKPFFADVGRAVAMAGARLRSRFGG
ncbi:MAG: hypothetical protein R3304_01275 [Longimicrobiales bacterium]|nr:hypothetical protein [Longimicrobiales bacterium]